MWDAMMSLDMNDRVMGNHPSREPASLMLSPKVSSKNGRRKAKEQSRHSTSGSWTSKLACALLPGRFHSAFAIAWLMSLYPTVCADEATGQSGSCALSTAPVLLTPQGSGACTEALLHLLEYQGLLLR